MKTTPLFICLTVIALSFNSCEKDKSKRIEEIGYGTSFGMCVGYCLNELSISTDEVVFSKTKNGDKPEPKTCKEAITPAEVDALKKLVNTSEFVKLPKVIGCPDCADGGAEWVSLRLDGDLKTVKFDYGKAPNELKALVTKLRALKEEFKDCN